MIAERWGHGTSFDVSLVRDRLGCPDVEASHSTPLGFKQQLFYKLGKGKARYIFFVDGKQIFDWIISEEEMERVRFDKWPTSPR